MSRNIRQILTLLVIYIDIVGLMGLTIENRPRLILLQQFMRHGGRYPTEAKQLVKNSYPKEKSGYLTDEGGRMSYLLGKQLNNLYWKKLFGNTKKLSKSKFRVRSTLFNRTIETAMAHNLGLLQNTQVPFLDQQNTHFTYPPFKNSVYHSPQGPQFEFSNKKAHFLPINSVEYDSSKSYEGDFLAKFTEQSCPRQKLWRANNLGGKRYQNVFQDSRYIATVKQFESTFNLTVGGVNSLARYYTVIASLKDLIVKLPALCYQSSPNFKDLSIYSTINFFICNYGQELQLHTLMTGIFDEITNNIKMKVALKEDYPSWFIYATHEEVIGGFLAIMDLMSIDCMLKVLQTGQESSDCEIEIPKFCSSIIFEFYQYSHTNKITFKVRYNGQYKKIHFCQNKFECDVNNLYSWFQTWRVADVRKTCIVQ